MADGGRHALVVSASTYRDAQLRQLAAPATDARNFASVLGKNDLGGFEVVRINDRDSHVVAQAIERFCGEREVNDTVVVYFSGHGLKNDRGQLYVAAKNTTKGLLRSTAISADWLREILSDCRARSQVLVLDCCFGGAFSRALLNKGDDDTVDVLGTFVDSPGLVVITASNAMQFAFEEELDGVQESVFTRVLVEGIRTGEADLDRDGRISVDDLFKFAKQRISTPGSKQTPTISSVGVQGDILVARARTRTPSLTNTTEAIGGAVTRPLDLRPWVRIHDVGSEASSAAIAAVTAMETSLAYNGANQSLSARYIYQKAKAMMKTPPTSDLGIEMPTLVEIMKTFGTVPEKAWPYKPHEVALPSGKTMRSMDLVAKRFKARLTELQSLDDIAYHLGQGRPIIAGFKVFGSTWLSPAAAERGEISAPPKNEALVGLTAVVIVDFDSEARLLRFANNWGTTWGDSGFGSMTVDAAKEMFVTGWMWAVEVGTERTAASFQWDPRAPAQPAALPAVPRPPATRAARRSSPQRAPRPTAGEPRRRTPTTTNRTSALMREVYDGEKLGADYAQLRRNALLRAEGDGPTGDSAVDRVYDAIGTFHQFFEQQFHRSSWNGTGAPYRAIVHYGRDFQNGFWDGRSQVVVLGDGDGELFNDFYDLDVVAKEFANGLIDDETELRPDGEPAALHNALSIILAAMVKQYHANETSLKSNWLIGERLLRTKTKGMALISLLNPGSAYSDPRLGHDRMVGHMKDYVKTVDDNGGIHTNSGIPCRAFALAARELRGRSWERAGAAWYKAITSGKVRQNFTFAQFAALTVKSADDPATAAAITKGWREVGVDVA